MDDPSSSVLLLIWPDVGMSVEDEVRSDVDRLLGVLLLLARSKRMLRRGTVWLGAVITERGRLKYVRDGRSVAWRDEDALAARLDALVAAGEVRALAQCGSVTLRRSDGLHDWTYPALRITAEHRDQFSYDLILPLEWALIRRPDVMDPQSVDRIWAGYPHRVWPGPALDPEDEPITDVDAGEAYRLYAEEGIYEELHRAVAIAKHELRLLADDDPGWPRAADRLASFLAARFRHSGNPGDLDQALAAARRAVEGSGQDPRLRARLGGLLGLQFARDGRLSVLDEAMEEARAAAVAADSLAASVETAEILGELLLTRYRTTAERELPAEALSILYAAARSQHAAGVDVSTTLAAEIGAAHKHRFDQTGDRKQLEDAIGALDFSLEAAKGGPESGRRLRDNALARQRYYEITGDEGKLQLAYVSLLMALKGTHDKSPERNSMKLALGSARVHRLARERLVEVIEEDGVTREAIDRFEGMDLPPWWLLLSRAIGLVQEVLDDLAEGSPERPAALAVLARLYRDAYDLSGNLDQLRQAAGAAAQGAEEWSSSFAAAPVAQKLGISSQGAELYQLAIDALIELADRDSQYEEEAHGEAFRLGEAAKSRLLTEQLGRGEVAIPPDVQGNLVEREQSLLSDLVAIDTAALAARDSGIAFRPDSERRERLAAELAEVWAAIAKRNPSGAEYVALRRGDTLDLTQLRDVVIGLGPLGALLSLYILEDRTVLFFADSDGSGFGVDQVPLGKRAWREAVRRFERELPRSYGKDVLPPTWEAPLRPLVEKAAEHLNGCGHLVVVPHGAAHGLPWAFLTRNWEAPDGESPAVSTVPALAVLDRLQKRRVTSSRGALVIGNPTGDLDDAEAEAEEVAHVLGVEPLIGRAATTDALDAAAQEAQVLHLACHAAFDPDSPLDSHIVLADGHWRARDALSRRLDAELVVLSACQTGVSGGLAGEELAGLSQAFLHAGSRAVIVSLWHVSDAAAADLMREFHAHRAAGTPVAFALREAADAIRREREHPWYWAAFALVGG